MFQLDIKRRKYLENIENKSLNLLPQSIVLKNNCKASDFHLTESFIGYTYTPVYYFGNINVNYFETPLILTQKYSHEIIWIQRAIDILNKSGTIVVSSNEFLKSKMWINSSIKINCEVVAQSSSVNKSSIADICFLEIWSPGHPSKRQRNFAASRIVCDLFSMLGLVFFF